MRSFNKLTVSYERVVLSNVDFPKNTLTGFGLTELRAARYFMNVVTDY